MAASLWLQLPPLQSPIFLSSSHSCSASPIVNKKVAPTRGNILSRSSVLVCSSNSSSSSSVVTKEEEGAAEAAIPAPPPPAPASYKNDPNFRGCKGCGRDEKERGCNGEGRIQGGIAAVPLFGWWPIKAYRPCPGFVASGGRYRRYGQSMDDVAAGRGRKAPSNNKKKSDK